MLTGFNVAGPLILDAQSVIPAWPWQYHALIGFVCFIIVMGWIIYDKQRKINDFEDSYEFALSFEGLRVNQRANDFQNLQIGLLFRNTIDKPLEYRVVIDSLYIEFGGNRPVNPKYSITGGVLPVGGLDQFKFAPLKMPQNFPCEGKLSYELVYGPPRKLKFPQKKEMEFDIQYISGQIYVNLTCTSP